MEQDSASQSVPSDHLSLQSSSIIQDVIVIEAETDSCESKDREERQEDRSEQAEEGKEEEEEEEVLLCFVFTFSPLIFCLEQRAFLSFFSYQEKQDVYEDEDNTDDNRTVGGEYSNKQSGEVTEHAGEDQFSETPNTAENICVTSDSPHPSESSHDGKPPLQSLKYGCHCGIISCDLLLFQEKEAVV